MIKVKFTEKKENKEIDYPCLMISMKSGSIVLFLRKDTGVVIASNKFPIGYFHDAIATDDFELYKGEITLSNGEYNE